MTDKEVNRVINYLPVLILVVVVVWWADGIELLVLAVVAYLIFWLFSVKNYLGYAAIVLLIYFNGVYQSFLHSEVEYVYEPKNDRVFLVRLVPNFKHCDKLTIFLPSKKCEAYIISEVEYLWKLQEKLALVEFQRTNPRAYTEKVMEDARALIENIKNGVKRVHTPEEIDKSMTDWKLKQISYINEDVTEFLPNSLSALKSKIPKSDVFTADIAVFKWKHTEKSSEVEIIQNAIFFRGEGVRAFVMFIDPLMSVR